MGRRIAEERSSTHASTRLRINRSVDCDGMLAPSGYSGCSIVTECVDKLYDVEKQNEAKMQLNMAGQSLAGKPMVSQESYRPWAEAMALRRHCPCPAESGSAQSRT